VAEIDLLLINLLNGIVFSFVLFSLATGFSLILGVMGILNLAHGAVFMVGAYLGWIVAAEYKWNFGLAILAGALGGALVGGILQQGFLRYLHKQTKEQVLLTAGFIFIITNLAQWVFGPIARPPFTPPFMSGYVVLWGLRYPVFRLAVILVGVVLYLLFWWLEDHTRVGAIVRAGMDDKEMTMGLGINLGRVTALVFLFGSAITGVAGVMGMQIMGADLQLPLSILKYALVVVVVGGVGSVHGALLGSVLIGVVDTFGKALFPEYAMFTIFLAMIFILLIRPSGLLGRKGVWG
jgi:branched-chain amino acid transport system permease protein